MCFAKSHAPIEKQWIVGTCRLLRHSLASRMCKTIARTYNERIKQIAWIHIRGTGRLLLRLYRFRLRNRRFLSYKFKFAAVHNKIHIDSAPHDSHKQTTESAGKATL